MADVVIGQDMSTGHEIGVSVPARALGTYVPGKTGMGKSTLFLNMIVQDIEQGRGVVVIDPHRDLVADVLERIPPNRRDDVILLDFLDQERPFGLNLFACSDPEDPEVFARTREQVMQVFEKLWGISRLNPLLSRYLRNVASTLIRNQGTTMADVPRLFADVGFRNRLVAQTNDDWVESFWQMHASLRPQERLENAEMTINKFDEFMGNPLVSQIVTRQTSVNLLETLDASKIVLVPLDAQLEQVTSLLGGVILGQILDAAYRRVKTPPHNRVPVALYVDEYHLFATPVTAELLTGGRKFGLLPAVAHQVRERLDDQTAAAVLQAGNMVVFGVIGEDAQVLSKQFKVDPKPREKQLKMVTEPLYQTWEDEYWDPPVAEKFWPEFTQSVRDHKAVCDAFSQSIPQHTCPVRLTSADASDPVRSVGVAFFPTSPSSFPGNRDHVLVVESFTTDKRAVVRPYAEWESLIERYLRVLAEGGNRYSERLWREIKAILDPIRFSIRYETIPLQTGDDPFHNCRPLYLPAAAEWFCRSRDQALQWHKDAEKRQTEFYANHHRIRTRQEYLGEQPVQDATPALYGRMNKVNRYREVDGPPRSINDVQNEIANQMATLDKHQAFLRCVTEDGSAEYLIGTLPPPASIGQWRPTPLSLPAQKPLSLDEEPLESDWESDSDEEADGFPDLPPAFIRR